MTFLHRIGEMTGVPVPGPDQETGGELQAPQKGGGSQAEGLDQRLGTWLGLGSGLSIVTKW